MSLNQEFSVLRNQFRPWSEFRGGFDRIFEDLIAPLNQVARTDLTFVPTCDVEEAENQYLLTVEMPGVSKEDIKLEVIDHQILISGERRTEKKQPQHAGYGFSERRFGKFQRTFTLPVEVDVDKVEAHYEDGILRVVIPKAVSTRPRQIKISQGKASDFIGKLMGKMRKEEEGGSPKKESEVA